MTQEQREFVAQFLNKELANCETNNQVLDLIKLVIGSYCPDCGSNKGKRCDCYMQE
jgi:hypothetical protein